MNFLESSEDYLERILILSKKNNGKVRSIDIAKDMGFSKASVSIAMKKLELKKMIKIEKSIITLTDDGLTIAKSTYERHLLIHDLLVKLGVNEKIAYEDACKIEHDISDETFDALRKVLKGLK